MREEREAEEARVAEEERELARQEQERTQQITEYFQYLQHILENVRLQQGSAIQKRHENDWVEVDQMRNELESPEKAAVRQAYVNSKRAKIASTTEKTIKGLRTQHAASIMEAITRHRRDQDELMAHTYESENMDPEVLRAENLAELIATQDVQRTTMKAEQAREIEKWKSRGEASLRDFDARMLALKMRLDEAENIDKREREIRRLIYSDGKWTETLFEDRSVMLTEDEQRLIRNGREVPPVPKTEKVIIPGKRVPPLVVGSFVSFCLQLC